MKTAITYLLVSAVLGIAATKDTTGLRGYADDDSKIITIDGEGKKVLSDSDRRMKSSRSGRSSACLAAEAAYLSCFREELSLEESSDCADCMTDEIEDAPDEGFCSDYEDLICKAPRKCDCSPCSGEIQDYVIHCILGSVCNASNCKSGSSRR